MRGDQVALSTEWQLATGKALEWALEFLIQNVDQNRERGGITEKKNKVTNLKETNIANNTNR